MADYTVKCPECKHSFEVELNRGSYTCGYCDEKGHNARTCAKRVRDESRTAKRNGGRKVTRKAA